MQLLPFKSIHFQATAPGVRVLILGAVHGNELHGTHGITRVVSEIDAGALAIARGSVTFVPITNPKAYALQQRNGDRNLNRNLAPSAHVTEYEDHVGNWLCPLMAQHDVLLDLHSFQAQGKPFALIGPRNNSDALQPFSKAAIEESLVARLGVERVVYGWLDTYAVGVAKRRERMHDAANRHTIDPKYGVGTTEYMRSVGGAAITLECGQHHDPLGAEVAYRAIRNTLAHLKISDETDPNPAAQMECLRLAEVIDRDDAGDTFAKSWTSFDAVAKGELIGRRADGHALQAPANGRIVFPNALAQPGNEWFYFAHQDARL